MLTRTLLAALLVAAFALPSTAQQQEVNSPGGSLVVNGMNPSPGSPFTLGPGVPITFRVEGTPNAPYALFVGQLATTSILLPPLANQYFDLDPTSVILLGDGISGGGLLPPFLFLLDPAGQATWSFPVGTGAVGSVVALQAAVQDTSLPPFDLNLTAAAEFEIVNRVSLVAQDFASYAFPSGAYPLYGSLWSSIDVSTSGWIRFGGGAANEDVFPNRVGFLGGSVGGTGLAAPIIAPLWGPWQFFGPGAEVVVEEIMPRITRVEWKMAVNAFNLQAVGSFSCTLDVTTGAPVVTFDYTSLVNPMPVTIPFATGNVVGISDGGVVGATQAEHDLATPAGANPFAPPGPVTLFQEFGPASPIGETVDLAGTLLTFFDLTAGAFLLY